MASLRVTTPVRADGFDGEGAVYAPTVLSEDLDAVLDAVCDYVARRPDVAARLPDGTPTDVRATGPARATLEDACEAYALVGDSATVRARVTTLREAGVDHVVAYPAAGLDAVLE